MNNKVAAFIVSEKSINTKVDKEIAHKEHKKPSGTRIWLISPNCDWASTEILSATFNPFNTTDWANRVDLDEMGHLIWIYNVC